MTNSKIINSVEEVKILKTLIIDKIVSITLSWGVQSFKVKDVHWWISASGTLNYEIIGGTNTTLLNVPQEDIEVLDA